MRRWVLGFWFWVLVMLPALWRVTVWRLDIAAPLVGVELMTLCGLIGVYYLRSSWRFAIPLLSVVVSEVFLPSARSTAVIVWTSWLLVGLVFVGVTQVSWLKRSTQGLGIRQWGALVGMGLGANVLFWLLSNAGVWAEGWLYPRTLEGLLLCYQQALPFLSHQLVRNAVILPVGIWLVEAGLLWYGSRGRIDSATMERG